MDVQMTTKNRLQNTGGLSGAKHFVIDCCGYVKGPSSRPREDKLSGSVMAKQRVLLTSLVTVTYPLSGHYLHPSLTRSEAGMCINSSARKD